MYNASRIVLVRFPSSRLNRINLSPTLASFQCCSSGSIQNQYPIHSFSTSANKKPSLATLVKELRLKTGAPMIECKKALEASENDLSEAMEWLRKYSLSKVSSKLENRVSDMGLVGLATSDDGSAALIKVSSETDFASRSATFSKLVQDVASTALGLKPSDDGNTSLSDLLLNMKVEQNENQTVQKYLEDATLSIRENLQLKEVELVLPTKNSYIMGYVHGKVPDYDCVGTSAALVELVAMKDDTNVDQVKEIGKKLAMHIVAAKPKYLNPESVPKELVDKEKEILQVQISAMPGNKSKPPEILEKIINGKLNKFYQEICLSKQLHMLEEKNPMIEKYLLSHGFKVKSYKYISI